MTMLMGFILGSSRYVVHDANFFVSFCNSNSTGTNTGNSKFTVSVFGTTFFVCKVIVVQ